MTTKLKSKKRKREIKTKEHASIDQNQDSFLKRRKNIGKRVLLIIY